MVQHIDVTSKGVSYLNDVKECSERASKACNGDYFSPGSLYRLVIPGRRNHLGGSIVVGLLSLGGRLTEFNNAIYAIRRAMEERGVERTDVSPASKLVLLAAMPLSRIEMEASTRQASHAERENVGQAPRRIQLSSSI